MPTWLVATFTNFTFDIIKNLIVTILIIVKWDGIYFKFVVYVDIIVNATVKTRGSILL